MARNELLFSMRWHPNGMFGGCVWSVRRNEQWVVAGPNGSGKTYLALLITGAIPPVDVDISMDKALEDNAALVTFSQQSRLASESWLQARWHAGLEDEAVSVSRFLSYDAVHEINPFEVRPRDGRDRREFAALQRRVVSQLEISSLFRRAMHHLSNGETRKVLIARALLKSPALLVLDDPFSGLDIDSRQRLHRVLERLATDGLRTVVTVRRADEVPRFATHMLTLARGGAMKRRRLSCRRKAPRVETAARSAVAPAVRSCGEPVVELRNITVRYGRRTVVQRLSWTVREGERWLLTGPNGSGKTTVLSLITGDNPAAYGQAVRVFGRPRAGGESLWEIRRRIGEVSPEIQCHFDRSMTALEAVLSGRIGRDGTVRPAGAKTRAAARNLLREMRLEGAGNRLLGELSPGSERLVLLARALLSAPELLILDEPFQNLDDRARKLVFDVLQRLMRGGVIRTVVLTAHHPDDVPPGFSHVLALPVPLINS